jgi:hypothetical protein
LGDGKSGLFIGEICASKVTLGGSTRRDMGEAPKRLDMEDLRVKAETYGELLEQVKLAIGAKFGGIRTFTEDLAGPRSVLPLVDLADSRSRRWVS